MRNALALIIGNASYMQEKHRLNNAENDADDVATKLHSLGFTVKKHTNTERRDFQEAIESFGADLKEYKIGLFYFAGHGLQIKGLNYLTAVDTSFADESSAKYTSIQLDHILDYMKEAGTEINIIILDACRDNPLPATFRGANNEGLAPIYAPKGTIIAFSTSPGEKAKDGGSGRNSIYTGSLLNHINDKDISIEDFFKRVRTSVYTHSGGEQTSWEHTSLIGTFSFNPDDIVHSVTLPYRDECVAEAKFISTGSKIDVIIEKLKSHQWETQREGMDTIGRLKLSEVDSSSWFLLGRNILQTAIGGEFAAVGIMKKLGTWLEKFNFDGINDVLNGMLYEVFFDANGHFRDGHYKSDLIGELYSLQIDMRYKKPFNFLRKILSPFRDHLVYWPNDPMQVLPIEINISSHEVLDWDQTYYTRHKLESVRHENVELLVPEKFHRQYNTIEVSLSEFKERLQQKLCVPQDKLRLSYNMPETDIKYVSIPYKFKLTRVRPNNFPIEA
jgi:hypothetical protein